MEKDKLHCTLAEVKTVNDSDGEMTFEGYGAVFGNVDLGGDMIVKGAFAESITKANDSGEWPLMLHQHALGFTNEDSMPVGVWTEMIEDRKGLKIKGTLAKTSRGKDLYELLKMSPRPAINGLSIGYIARDVTYGEKPKEPRRTLKSVDLLEVSLVSFPMNPKARVSAVKSIDELEDLKAAETFLRDLGMSRKQALAFVSRVKKLGLSQSDSVTDDDTIKSGLDRLINSMSSHRK